ncbi:DUF6551 family protein [Pelagibacterium lacus]|uniref:ParB/Sulfiredoxin domain-containing protein n=1 Tax=Pelagibacterium lacus TaxID=2282655 RepID=A0A369W114_9HYPH|nr:DUF6551 family protein [Pelagibacterium lacus]RDE08366.1 hypothetical protein DVH29_11585 [Pelagibacterium lacus]
MTETLHRDPGPLPDLDWIDVSLIDVDPTYQRGIDENRVQKILDWFSWRSFGALTLSKIEGGRYHAIDGQHRLEAAKRHPSVTLVPCTIIEAGGTVAEAETFVTVNANRKNVSPLEMYWAELAADDPEALTIAQVTNRAGVTIMRHPGAQYEPGQTVAVSAIRSLVDKRGAMRARQILEVLAKAELAPIKGEHVRAAEILMTDDEFRHSVEPDALSEALSGNGEEFSIEAKAFAKTHRMPVGRALASVWFRKTRKKRKAA